MLGSLEVGFSGLAGLREDLSLLVIVVLTIALAFALYVTNLYRGSWNRRAARINAESEQM